MAGALHVVRLAAHLHVAITVGLHCMRTGIVEGDQTIDGVQLFAAGVGLGGQRCTRLQRVVVGAAMLAGMYAARTAPMAHHRAHQAPVVGARRRIRQAVHAILRCMRTQRIGQHQGMRTAAMGEVVVDAFAFQQPADEAEIVLAVLHAVGALGVLRAQLLLHIAVADLAQHAGDDLRHAHVLIDTAIAALCQQPWFGHHLQFQHGVLERIDHGVAVVRATGHHAVIPALFALAIGQLHRHWRAKQITQVGLQLGAQRIDAVVEQLPQRFAGLHAVQQQALAKVGVQHDGARHRSIHR